MKSKAPLTYLTSTGLARMLVVAWVVGFGGIHSWAQDYSLHSHTGSGGGGVSTGGVYSVTASFTPQQNGGALAGGSYSMSSGFLSVIGVVPTIGVPDLTLYYNPGVFYRPPAGKSVLISWPNSGDYMLLYTTNLAGGVWTTNTSRVTTFNGTNSIVMLLNQGQLFLKLSR